MSNSFYYLPRVSDNGQPDGPGFEICGKEKGWQRNPATGVYAQGNYVVDPYAEQYGGTTISGNFSDYFNFAFFSNNGTFANATMASSQWDVYKVSDVLNGRGDNYTGTDKVTDKDGNATHKPGDYHVWRYVTENAIPAGPSQADERHIHRYSIQGPHARHNSGRKRDMAVMGQRLCEKCGPLPQR